MTATSTAIDPDALRYMLGIPKGRAVLWDIIAAAGLFRSAFSAEERLTDFNLGNQNLGLIVYSDCMAVSPDLTALMIREQGDYDNDDAGKPDTSSGERGSSASGSELTPGLGFTRFNTDLGN